MPDSIPLTDRKYDQRTGSDAELRERLGRIADEVAARNTRVAIAVPVPEIIAAFHEVYADAARVPHYDHDTAMQQSWSAAPNFATDEIPEQAPELRVWLPRGDTDEVVVAVETLDRVIECALPLDRAESFFLAGLAAVRAGKAARAARPVEGISQDEVTARLAERGIVVTAD